MTKKVLACLLAMMLALSLLPGTAGAASVVASGTCGADGDNVTWSLDSDGVLTISGTGKMADYTAGWSVHGHNAETPWFGFQISSIVVEQGVTRIGDCAFAMQYGTNSILLPEGLEEIGSDCFWGGDGGYIDQITLPSTGIRGIFFTAGTSPAGRSTAAFSFSLFILKHLMVKEWLTTQNLGHPHPRVCHSEKKRRFSSCYVPTKLQNSAE